MLAGAYSSRVEGSAERAITLTQAGVDAYLQVGDSGELGWAYENLGMRLAEAGRHADAAEVTRLGAEVYRRLGPGLRSQRAAMLVLRGAHLSHVDGQDALAISETEAAVAAYAESGDSGELGWAYENLGMRLAEAGRHADAAEVTRLGAEVYRRLGPGLRSQRASMLVLRGAHLSHVDGQDALAISETRQAVALYTELGDDSGLAWARENLGNRLAEAGLPQE